MKINQQSIVSLIEEFIATVQAEVEELKVDLAGISEELSADIEGKLAEITARLEELKRKVLNWEFESVAEFIGVIKAEIEKLKADFDWLKNEVEGHGGEAEAEIKEMIDDIKDALDTLWEGILDEVGEDTGNFLEKYKVYIIGAAIALAVVVGLLVIF